MATIKEKPWYMSKTIWLAILQGAAGILAAFLAESPDFQSLGYLVALKAIIDFMLRTVTKQPIA